MKDEKNKFKDFINTCDALLYEHENKVYKFIVKNIIFTPINNIIIEMMFAWFKNEIIEPIDNKLFRFKFSTLTDALNFINKFKKLKHDEIIKLIESTDETI